MSSVTSLSIRANIKLPPQEPLQSALHYTNDLTKRSDHAFRNVQCHACISQIVGVTFVLFRQISNPGLRNSYSQQLTMPMTLQNAPIMHSVTYDTMPVLARS